MNSKEGIRCLNLSLGHLDEGIAGRNEEHQKKGVNKRRTNMANTMSADDKRWQAEQDARTLVEAESIRTEKGRLGKALKEITKQNKVKEKEIKLANKVVKSKKPSKPTRKPTKTTRKSMKTTRKVTRRKR